MKKLFVILSLLFTLCYTPVSAFVVPIPFEEKCLKSDIIVRGVVVKIIHLSEEVENSRNQKMEGISDSNFSGPSALAMVRVTSILKGDSKRINGVIFIPCGYSFDESPSELTKSKEYLLFLGSMNFNYYHPLDPFSMHRIERDVVSSFGGDSDRSFEADAKPEDTVKYEEFAKRIQNALKRAKSPKEGSTETKTEDKSSSIRDSKDDRNK